MINILSPKQYDGGANIIRKINTDIRAILKFCDRGVTQPS
jgi:hypothetical protein